MKLRVEKVMKFPNEVEKPLIGKANMTPAIPARLANIADMAVNKSPLPLRVKLYVV